MNTSRSRPAKASPRIRRSDQEADEDRHQDAGAGLGVLAPQPVANRQQETLLDGEVQQAAVVGEVAARSRNWNLCVRRVVRRGVGHHRRDVTRKVARSQSLRRSALNEAFSASVKQSLLAAKVALDQRDVRAGLGGDVAQGLPVVAEARELRLGRLEDGGARRLGVTPARRDGRALSGRGTSDTRAIRARAGMTTVMLS